MKLYVKVLHLQLQKGENNIIWDGKNASGKMVSSGSYFIHILNENNNLIEKVTLMK